ncbi:MAG: murein peptide amidase A [Actinobacteria bacterium]|nr:MAG: murein peptide amidase A [Actinomycetota bacterium]
MASRRRRLRGRTLTMLGLAAAGCAAAVAGCGASHRAVFTAPRSLTPQGRTQSRTASDPLSRRRVYLGRSVDGRRIYAVKVGDLDNEHSLLVVGDIHGNEPAGIPIANAVASSPPPRESLIIVIKNLNPDGVAAKTRQNADGVDLNRNFPWRWRPLGSRGDLQYSGPRPLSEPEARIAHSLILRTRPQVTIWFHQPLGLVDESGGSISVEHRFARLSGLPLRRLTRYPGSAAGWQNHRLPGTTAFVVELPGGTLSPTRVSRYAAAVRALSRS